MINNINESLPPHEITLSDHVDVSRKNSL